MHQTTRRLVERLTEAVNDLSEWPIPEEDTPDVVGHLKAAVRKLDTANKNWAAYPGLKQRLLEEMDPAAVGADFEAVESPFAKRSYNTDKLLADIARASQKDLPATLRHLINADALELKWRYRELQNVAAVWDVPLLKTYHEIQDGDPEFHLGEVWSSRVDVQPRMEETNED